ncbi:hypothetical protein KOW79_011003 [Hemibagrus wyckioides]|uniref:Uncharacterized protein n=1 Tax=Hemibagrus wyckioides TaxID=337641 RepID=A0A9D3NNC7_9TELE|nr:hypothetical protein KOW79_011003 [Hemibagrus wyckioides]
MSFSQKEYIFSQTITKVTDAHQPVVFKIDLSELLSAGQHSPLFVIDSMSVTAYKRGTLERILVKFSVIRDTKKRVLTNDPWKLSSKWLTGINSDSAGVKIAGTDTIPFNRSLARSRDSPGPSEENSNSHCMDGAVCVIPVDRAYGDKEFEDLRSLLALLRSACMDNLGMLQWFTRDMPTSETWSIHLFQDLNCATFPPRHIFHGDIVIPHPLMRYVVSLYGTMAEHVENFAIVDETIPHVKVLVKSLLGSIGEITGHITITVIYGSSVSVIYDKLSAELEHSG